MDYVIINWVIAFLALAIYYLRRYKKRNNKEMPFNILQWLEENIVSCVISAISVIILMLIFITPETVQFIDHELFSDYKWIKHVPYTKIFSLIIGITNVWLIDTLVRKGKKKIAGK